jgi:hypothetical protein
MNCWYNRLGPITWYKREWIGLNLTAFSRVLLIVLWKPGRYFSVKMGGRVTKWSMFGSAVMVEPRWHWDSDKRSGWEFGGAKSERKEGERVEGRDVSSDAGVPR